MDKLDTVRVTVTAPPAHPVRNRHVEQLAEDLALKQPLQPLHAGVIAHMVDVELRAAVRVAAGAIAQAAVK